jgi:hypothetical protein
MNREHQQIIELSKKERSLLRAILIVTAVGAIGLLMACVHIASNIPVSSESFGKRTIDDLLTLLRILVCKVIPAMAVYLLLLAGIFWFRILGRHLR